MNLPFAFRMKIKPLANFAVKIKNIQCEHFKLALGFIKINVYDSVRKYGLVTRENTLSCL